MKRTLLLILAVMMIFTACRGLQIGPKGEGEYVFGESLVPIDEENMKDTRERGVYAAQKNAVEQVAGVFLSSSTVVDQASIVENKILTKTQGFIRRYYVTDDYRKGEYWYTRVKALVLVSDINSVVRENEDVTSKRTNIVVASREMIDANISMSQDCKQAIYKGLKNAPYALLSGDSLSEANLEDPTPIIDKARYDGARFIVIADASSAPVENLANTLQTPFKPYRARANLRVYSTRNYAVAAEGSSQQSGLDALPNIAGQKAIAAACEMAVKEVVAPLNSAVNSATKYSLTIKEVKSIDRLKEVQGILRDLREIEDFNLVRYKNSAAEFDVQANIKNSEELIAKIIRKHGAQFTVLSSTPYSIVLLFV